MDSHYNIIYSSNLNVQLHEIGYNHLRNYSVEKYLLVSNEFIMLKKAGYKIIQSDCIHTIHTLIYIYIHIHLYMNMYVKLKFYKQFLWMIIIWKIF